jgi:hypothetical protein
MLAGCGGSAARSDAGRPFAGRPADAGQTPDAGLPPDVARPPDAGAPSDAAPPEVGGGDSQGRDALDAPGRIDGGACTAVVAQHPEEGFQHLTCPAPLAFGTVPPSSGNHYGEWADFHTYPSPVHWGNLMHSMEHGAVVIVYNCPGGCPDEVSAAQVFIDNLPADPLCTDVDARRVILAPDPTLDVRWAAAAWTWTLRADCFDHDAFAAFVRDHYAQGRENFCTELHTALCPL